MPRHREAACKRIDKFKDPSKNLNVCDSLIPIGKTVNPTPADSIRLHYPDPNTIFRLY